jgi:uncharacterized protein (TIGR04255 family)
VNSLSRHYRRAPITEAIIAFQCELPASTNLEKLADIHARIKAHYPKRADQYQMGLRLQPSTPPLPLSDSEIVGYRFARADDERAVNVTKFGDFAFSWLAPYDRWNTFRAEAKQAWDAYESVICPGSIKRIGVRFVNRFDIPVSVGGAIDLDVYLRTAPRIAPDLPQSMKKYFIRVELPGNLSGGLLIITEATVEPPRPDLVSVLLDIDAIVQNTNLSATDAWHIVDQLRHEKNQTFEACITDSMRSLIE